MNKRYGAPVSGDEKQVLGGFLDHYRATLLDICEGLSDEDQRRSFVPSGTSLLGMVKHLAYVERGRFQEGIANGVAEYPFSDSDPDADFRNEPDEMTEEIFDLYRAECAKSRLPLRPRVVDLDPRRRTGPPGRGAFVTRVGAGERPSPAGSRGSVGRGPGQRQRARGRVGVLPRLHAPADGDRTGGARRRGLVRRRHRPSELTLQRAEPTGLTVGPEASDL